MAEPPITIRASYSDPDSSAGDNLPIVRIVIHGTCGLRGYPAESAAGAAHSTALYFASGTAGGSAQYICDVAGEEHCVPDNVVAYHAPPNTGSIGIEICADGGAADPHDYTRDQWLSPQVWPAVLRAAARARELCQRYSVPMVQLSVADLLAGRRGICGHVDVAQAWRQSDHTDPGPGFPWPEFMAAVAAPATAQEDDMPTAQEIAAAVWQHPIRSNRVASAEVMLANADSFANGAIPAIIKALLDEPISRADQHRGPTTLRAQLAWEDAHVDALAAGIRASLTALQAASPAGSPVDAGQIAVTVRQSVSDAFQHLKISAEPTT